MVLRAHRHLGDHLGVRDIVELLGLRYLLLIERVVEVTSFLVLAAHVQEVLSSISKSCGVHRRVTS